MNHDMAHYHPGAHTGRMNKRTDEQTQRTNSLKQNAFADSAGWRKHKNFNPVTLLKLTHNYRQYTNMQQCGQGWFVGWSLTAFSTQSRSYQRQGKNIFWKCRQAN